jgi:hypothetical protein
MPRCLDGYNQTTQQCTQSKDEGYNQCTQTQDQGYNQCNGWGWFSFLCDAWVWVSHIVCVAWTWISNIVCVVWAAVTVFVCLVWDVLSTVIIAIVHTIVSILSPILNAIALVIQFIFAIPILGRILNAIWNVILTIISFVASLLDGLAWIIGIRPEKHLYLVVMNQKDEKGNPVASDADMLASINLAIQAYRNDANIRVLPFKEFDYTNPESKEQQASDDYLVNLSSPSTAETLDVDCGVSDFTANLGFAGSQFQNMMNLSSFWTNWSRLIGYGAPIFAFSVRSFAGTYDGCSMGPLTDYILVEFTNAATDTQPGQPANTSSILPHEMGHCCNLWHVSPNNLMQANNPRTTNLSWWEIVLVRASRHVTYFG